MSQALEDLKELKNIPDFHDRITGEEYRYTADKMEVMQINVGRLCNLACKHCHVEAGPGRTEIMDRKVMEACLFHLPACSRRKYPLRSPGTVQQYPLGNRYAAGHTAAEKGEASSGSWSVREPVLL